MLTLALVRHGKAVNPKGRCDHERPLAPRGRRDAPLMGAWLGARGIEPDFALVSYARRTRETWEGLQAGGLSAEAKFCDALYHAPATTIRHKVAARRERSLIVVGHNPGLGRLAEQLTRCAPPHERFYDFPTCAALVLRFEEDEWDRAMRSKGDLAAFAVPGDLLGNEAAA